MPMLERRAAHVRPRPPSGDRLHGRPARSVASAQSGLRFRPLRARGGLPLPVGIAAVGVFAIVSVLVLTVGIGLLGGIFGEIGRVVGDAVARVASQAPATAGASGVALDTPALDRPVNNGYTSQSSVVLSGSVPRAALGKSGYLVRIYSLTGEADRAKVTDAHVGDTTRFTTSAVTLTEGSNTFVAVLVSPSGEGNSSPPIIYTLDTKAPRLTITSPGPNVLTQGTSINVSGRSEQGVTITVRNRHAPGGALNSVVVGAGETFTLNVKLVAGDNTIDVTATDKANNSTAAIRLVKRDYGKLAAHLVVSPTKIKTGVSTTLTLTVHATSSTGSPLADASVVFTVNVSGLGPMLSPEKTTDAKGTATWTTTISGAVPGSGWASVLVTSDTGDQIQGSTALNAY